MSAKTTITEENYLKAIFKHSQNNNSASTNTLAVELKTTPASVTDMIKKLNEKELVDYKPYRGVRLTLDGEKVALGIIRRHRLWEVFLSKKLKYAWDEVHQTAEQLEHINHTDLIEKLDCYLGHPQFDPHGDPIPTHEGKFTDHKDLFLSELEINNKARVIAVTFHDDDFLSYLSKIKLIIGAEITVLDFVRYDNSRELQIGEQIHIVHSAVVNNIIVERLKN